MTIKEPKDNTISEPTNQENPPHSLDNTLKKLEIERTRIEIAHAPLKLYFGLVVAVNAVLLSVYAVLKLLV